MKNYIVLFISFLSITVFAQLDRSKAPVPEPSRKVEIGKYTKFELKNGLKVFVIENHRLPRVTFSMSFVFDPSLEGENTGIGTLTGSLIGTGTKTRSKNQINESIDFMSASLSANANSISASSLKKYSNDVLQIMADVAIHSVFNSDELEKKRTQMISDIVSSKDDPNSIAQNVFSMVIFGENHPYGEFETEASIKNVTVEMCTNYYKTYFVPNTAYLAVVGDITVEEAKTMVEKYFEKWEKGVVKTQIYTQPQAPKTNRVVIVDRPQSVQSVIQVGYPIDLKISSPDYITSRVANTILGGVFCRLDQNLREKHAFTYGARSAISVNPLVSSFVANTNARNSVTDSAVVQILYEMKRMCNETVGDTELLQVKNYVAGNFALSLENPQTIASFAINTERYNLPADFYTNYLQSIEKITADDIRTTSCKYIHPNNTVIFAVGKADEIKDKLKPFSSDNNVEFFDTDGNIKK